jgi:hypothetical protein
MADGRAHDPTLPLPKFALVLLGIPTFYTLLAYLAVVIYAPGWVSFWEKLQGPPADWLSVFVFVAPLFVTVVMWPVYWAWVLLAKRLTWQERFLWLFLVTFLNMVGMAWFYVFIIRRYLGIEGRTGRRDEAALDRFLTRCGIRRDDLSAGQIAVLRSYCRTRRLAAWLLIPAVIFSAIVIHCAVAFPRGAIEAYVALSPERVIIVDTAKNTRKELTPDPETRRLQVQALMMTGAMFAMLGGMGLLIPVAAAGRLLPNYDRRTLMNFLKARKTP